MFKDRWKIGSVPGSAPDASGAGRAAVSGGAPPVSHHRQSPGLEQFINGLRDEESSSVLDLAGASQANVSFLTNLGHRLYSDDIVHALDSAFGEGDFFANQSDSAKVDVFMSQTLDFPEGHFGGALVWDTLQFLAPPLLQQTVDQLYDILRPGASLLAFFHADEKQTTIPVYSYRIADSKTVMLAPKGRQRTAQFFNNRNIEKMFARYRSVKFFLTRDHLREVLVHR